jgi:hypothetical protein
MVPADSMLSFDRFSAIEIGHAHVALILVAEGTDHEPLSSTIPRVFKG